MYLIASSSIVHQPVFEKIGFAEQLNVLEKGADLVQPDYKKYIQPALLRRMSKVLRMSVAAASDCLAQNENKAVDAIIVGTGLGCLDDTEKFLNNILTLEGGLLPPTSFIQSTHNTIAGQISLILQNHCYNMTHTQNTLSFEHALIDTQLFIHDGKKKILTGAADEFIPQLDAIAIDLNLPELHFTSGVSFFLFSPQPESANAVNIKSVEVEANSESPLATLDLFLQKESLQKSEIDAVLFSTPLNHSADLIQSAFPSIPILNYIDYCGMYFTGSAFALHLAADILISQKLPSAIQVTQKLNRILIWNQLNPNQLGLILIERCDI